MERGGGGKKKENDTAHIIYATTLLFPAALFLSNVGLFSFGKEGRLSCERKGDFHVSHLNMGWIFPLLNMAEQCSYIHTKHTLLSKIRFGI